MSANPGIPAPFTPVIQTPPTHRGISGVIGVAPADPANEGTAAAAFADLCRRRFEAGLREYRNGDPTRPFVGDPVREAIDEAADLAIYADVAATSGRISQSTAEHVRRLAERAFEILARHEGPALTVETGGRR